MLGSPILGKAEIMLYKNNAIQNGGNTLENMPRVQANSS